MRPGSKSFIKFSVLPVLFVLLPVILPGQSFTLTGLPALVVPTGPIYAPTEEVAYDIGFKMSVQGKYAPGASGFRLNGVMDYTLLPIAGGNQSSLSLVALGIGPGFEWETGGRFRFNTSASAGYYFGFLNGESGGNFFAQADTGGGFSLSPSTDLNLSVGYSYYLASQSSGFSNAYNGISISIGVSYRPGSGTDKTNLEIPIQNFPPIFPVLHSTYDAVPIGSITIENKEAGPVEDIRVSYYLPRYMDSPRQIEPVEYLKKNEKTSIDLFALLDKTILDETEGTAANAKITVSYKFRGLEKSFSEDLRADVLFRNALLWDDDRKAASFVTAKEPSVLTLSRNSLNIIREYPNQGTDTALRQAMAVWESLRIYGLSYVIDPDSAYEKISTEGGLDFLQFPVETLTYQAGDCDDLSVLFASLLESLSLETAFITVPGHIYMAFALDIDPDEAESLFPRSQGDLIIRDGKVWIPVETTLIESNDFTEAWRVGASEWKKYNDEGKTGFWPVREAWQVYKPVGLIASSDRMNYPDPTQVYAAYGEVLTTFISREIRFRVLELEEEIETSSGLEKQRKQNALGVLYARNGLYNDGIAVLRPIAGGSNAYVPAQLNLANLYYLTDNLRQSAEYYRLAAKSLRNPAKAYLGLAMVENELGNNDAAIGAYKQFASLEPDKADRYAYLAGSQDTAGRAAQAGGKDKVLWESEE